MNKIPVVVRLSIGLALLTLTILFFADALGLIPNPQEARLSGRKEVCNVIAIQFSLAAKYDELERARDEALAIKQRHPDILSIAIRRPDGKLILDTGDHETYWQENSNTNQVKVPILQGDRIWRTIEICFSSLSDNSGIKGILFSNTFRLSVFVSLLGCLLFMLYLRKSLRHLDPSAVIPDRVKAILDTLAEGVLILDNNGNIVLANEAFIEVIGRPIENLRGRKASDIEWTQIQSDEAPEDFPWNLAMKDGQNHRSVPMALNNDGKIRTFMVNSSPICGTDGKPRGALATFDDVSWLEEKNTKLERALTLLQDSRNKIKRQNEDLKKLSSRDPLTDCLNRRSFFERFEAEWSGKIRYKYQLGCIMVDVDLFKNINDNHGHAVGDQVLQQVASRLKSTARKTDLVCRYGGEEFCVLLPHTDIERTYEAAERFRKAIEEQSCSNINVTVSVGASSDEQQAKSPQELIDQADKALYAAKRAGRNQVIRWDQMPSGWDTEQKDGSNKNPDKQEQDYVTQIPYHAVAALMSALEHRDALTAQHSRGVADLCVAVAKDLLSAGDCFVLEVAALLHDIGKLGVPDAILLKPGPLTDEEWEVMSKHDRLGIEIINASFGAPELTNIVQYSHAWFGGNPREPDMPTGQEIPLRARILLIADAYEAMVSDRVYRKGRSSEEAFAELRRCAGTQFDPELVKLFIDTISARIENRSQDPVSENQGKALALGLSLERLACAVETQDTVLLKIMVDRLIGTAIKAGLPRMAELAEEFKQLDYDNQDITSIIEHTNELLSLCQEHQDSLIEKYDPEKAPSTPVENEE
ncbi:MAG: diguanylate cyclase [Sedimentisphaerales bacterium]|nr:diguanylate cyclase [Sedimentisphaerales bacterium]